jgi:hypothetical protein
MKDGRGGPGFGNCLLLVALVVGVSAAGEILTEDVFGLPLWPGVLILSPLVLGALLLAWRRPALVASVRMSVVLIAALVVGGILGTLIIQDQDIRDADPEREFETFAFAQAGLLVKGGDLFRAGSDPALSESERRDVTLSTKRFGERAGREREADLVRSKSRERDRQRITAYVDRHEGAFRELRAFAVRTRLSDIFRSWGFNALLAALALSILTSLVIRWPYPGGRLGFPLAHAAILVILGGAAISAIGVDRGWLQLRRGQGSPGYFSQTAGAGRAFPGGFTVGVRDIATRFWHELVVGFPGDGVESRFLVREGRSYTVDGGRVRIELGLYEPEADVGVAPWDRPAGPSRPGILVRLLGEGSPGAQWLVPGIGPGLETWRVHALGRVVTFRIAKDEDALRALTEVDPREPALGRLTVRMGETTVGPVDVTLGGSLEVPDSGGVATVRFLAVAKDLEQARVGVPLEFQTTTDPAVHLEIARGAQRQRVWARSGETSTGREDLAGLRASYEHRHLPPEEMRIVEGPSGGLRVVASRGGGSERQSLRLGEAIVLPGHPPFVVEKRFERFGLRPVLAGEGEAAPGAVPLRTGVLEVTVSMPDGERKERLIASESPRGRPHRILSLGDGPDRVDVGLVTTSVREYATTLEIRDADGTTRVERLRVNHPVRHGGFRFYQSNVDDHERPDPQASVLQIVDDPGIPVVYGGLAMMFLGIVWMLVIEPARRGRERRRARGEAVAPAPVGKEELVDVR